MARFFTIPFATSAAKTTIPDTDSVSVSWSNGYTVNYEYDPTVAGNGAKHVERDVFNTLLYDVTSSLQAIQVNGVAPFYSAVTAASGPGYNEGAIVIYANKTWRSKLSGNKITPNASTTANWEEVMGYGSLVTRLKSDGLVGSGGGGSNGDTYTKEEVDMIFNSLSDTLNEYYLKDLGEIFLLTWCDEGRNAEGFFMCNGDMFPYTDADPTSSDEFYGNALYSLCYDTTGDTPVETDFKKRWDIVVDESNKAIGLPNILGKSDDDYSSDTQNVLVALNKKAAIHGSEDADDSFKMFARDYPVAEANAGGDLVLRVTMIPCIYLGVYDNKDDENTEEEG